MSDDRPAGASTVHALHHGKARLNGLESGNTRLGRLNSGLRSMTNISSEAMQLARRKLWSNPVHVS